METYSLLREIADSWVLLAMFLFFVAVAIWAFLPSQRAARDDASMIPFRDTTPSKSSSSARADANAAKLKGDINV